MAATLVTLSAPYGAGGSYVGPQLAERLGVAFVDRAIPSEVARRLAVPLAEAVRRDEAIGSLFDRVVRMLAPVGAAYGARPMDPEALDEQSYRLATEEVIREEAGTRGGVILGRAGALVLAGVPGALHVRLFGPREARIEQAMRLEAIDARRGEPSGSPRTTAPARRTCATSTAPTRRTCGTTTWRSTPPGSTSTTAST